MGRQSGGRTSRFGDERRVIPADNDAGCDTKAGVVAFKMVNVHPRRGIDGLLSLHSPTRVRLATENTSCPDDIANARWNVDMYTG
jgi:hypothetical protein